MEVRFRVRDMDIQKYVARVKEPTKAGLYKKDILKFGQQVAALMTDYFTDGSVHIACDEDKTSNVHAVRIYLASLQLPFKHDIGYNFFIDEIMVQNVSPSKVVLQRLTEFRNLLDTHVKGMGHSVKWMLPDERRPPSEVVAEMDYNDMMSILL